MHDTRKGRLARFSAAILIICGLCLVVAVSLLLPELADTEVEFARNAPNKASEGLLKIASGKFSHNGSPVASLSTSRAPASASGSPGDLFLSRCAVLQQSQIYQEGSICSRFLLVRDSSSGKLFRVEEEWSSVPDDGSTRFVSRYIFSASQILIRVAPDARTSDIEKMLARSGLGLRLSRPVVPGVFKVELSQFDLDSVPRALDALRPHVLHVEADGIGFGAGSATSDPYFPQQWNLAATNPSGVDIGASSLWDAVPSGEGVTIAVLDSGVDYTHPDLNALERRGFDFVNDDGDPSDDHGHGTGVAGVILAARNNGFGTAGILPGARLLAVRVLDNNNKGSTVNLIQGLAYARTNGASVVNLSLVEYPPSPLVSEQLELCESNNMIICVAAGNHGTDNDQAPDYPSSYTNANIISVGGHDKTGARWSVATNNPSNFGASSVDIFAPGGEILSGTKGGLIWTWSGTSFAAPHVAAVAAALRVLRTNWTAFQIKSVILSSAATNSALAALCVSGGRLDAAAAVSVTNPPPTPTPTPTPTPAPSPAPTPSGTRQQTVRLSLPSKVVYGSTYALTASTSSKLPLTFGVSDPSIAQLTGRRIKILQAKPFQVTATQAGNSKWAPASKTVDVTPAKRSQRIGFTVRRSAKVGQTLNLNTTLRSGLTVTVTSSDENKIRIDGKTATVLAPGRVTLTATQSGDDNHAGAKPVERTVVVR